MGTKYTLPCSQELVTGPYRDPDASSSQSPTVFPGDPLQYYTPIYA